MQHVFSLANVYRQIHNWPVITKVSRANGQSYRILEIQHVNMVENKDITYLWNIFLLDIYLKLKRACFWLLHFLSFDLRLLIKPFAFIYAYWCPTRYSCRLAVTRRMALVEQELLTIPACPSVFFPFGHYVVCPSICEFWFIISRCILSIVTNSIWSFRDYNLSGGSGDNLSCTLRYMYELCLW